MTSETRATAKSKAAGRRSAAETRDHVLATAHELFYWRGIRAVGVDTVARDAGVAPTTLYRLFDSKDDLVAAYVERTAAAYRDWFTAAVESRQEPRERILAVFDALIAQVQPDVCRGCPFLMALSECPDTGVGAHDESVELKAWVRDQFAALTRDLTASAPATTTDPEALADQLTLVMEGVYASVQALGVDGPARHARDLVATLLATAAPTR